MKRACTYQDAHVEVTGQLMGLDLSFHNVSLRDLTKIIKLGYRHLYPPSHLLASEESPYPMPKKPSKTFQMQRRATFDLRDHLWRAETGAELFESAETAKGDLCVFLWQLDPSAAGKIGMGL